MTSLFKQRSLGDILIDSGTATPEQIADALAAHGEDHLAQALLEAGAVTPEQIAEALSIQCHLPYVDLDRFLVPPELFDIISAAHAFKYCIVPYRLEADALQVVTADPFNLNLLDQLERLARRPVQLALSSERAILAALKRSEGTSEVLRDVSEDFKIEMVVDSDDDGEDQQVPVESAGESSPIVKLVNTMLLAAIQKRASDVHIETYEKGMSLKYRIDGVLYPATEALDRRHHSALISRLKVMAELDIAEKRIPQDGRFKLRVNGRDIDFRVSILPSVFGEDVVIRILDKTSISEGLRNIRLESLGIAPEVLKTFRKSIREPYGMVLITGPTGSGKTTTLYAALGELNSGEEKIITIEDPVEYQLEGVVQIPVNEKKNLTFARGLRSILRHDPDKIMVGEIRDSETAQIAVQSALTGHLVFTTVHANNAFDVIGRFAHMGIDTYNFVSALNCVMAQRLVRIVCPQCRQPAQVSDEMLDLSGLEPARFADHTWYEGRGCDNCSGTGYRGRNAITEFLALSPRIRQMIVERRAADELREAAIGEGMITLRQSALAMALAGQTTLKEINRVTFVE